MPIEKPRVPSSTVGTVRIGALGIMAGSSFSRATCPVGFCKATSVVSGPLVRGWASRFSVP